MHSLSQWGTEHVKDLQLHDIEILDVTLFFLMRLFFVELQES